MWHAGTGVGGWVDELILRVKASAVCEFQGEQVSEKRFTLVQKEGVVHDKLKLS